jgi:CDP-paratose 2-epimerase
MKVIITGGAGFIGCNAAEYYAKRGNNVLIFDDLSRKGSPKNLDYLKSKYSNIDFIKGDIRKQKDMQGFYELAKNADLILHLAAQVAVTTSVTNPKDDFERNALGTFNVLEAARKLKEDTGKNPVLVYSSTNKVYGKMDYLKISEKNNEYFYKDLPQGIDENSPLDFYSPYGCSKGAGDQYVRDYSRIYGLNTVVMRQSCIYGRRQFGVEDQGWVAWFTIANELNLPVTIYGDGKQVRDILFVDDLVEAYELARKNISKTKGQVYNVGGGPLNRLSLLNLVSKLEKLSGKKINPKFSDWRPGDQKVCIMDISGAKRDLGWQPKIDVEKGIYELYTWVKKHNEEIRPFF